MWCPSDRKPQKRILAKGSQVCVGNLLASRGGYSWLHSERKGFQLNSRPLASKINKTGTRVLMGKRFKLYSFFAVYKQQKYVVSYFVLYTHSPKFILQDKKRVDVLNILKECFGCEKNSHQIRQSLQPKILVFTSLAKTN